MIGLKQRDRAAGRRRRSIAIALGLAAGVSLAGCGGGASGSAGESGTVRVIEANQHDPTIMGAEAGNYFNTWSQCKPTVKVTITAGQKVAEAVAAGSADVGIASPNRVIGAINQGLEAKIIGSSLNAWDMYLTAGAGSSARSLGDLKGKTFGVSTTGSAGHYATVAAARKLGWGEKDYKIVTLGSIDGLSAGLKNGSIDAFLWSAATAFSLQKAGTAKVLENVRDIVGPNALNVVFASDSYIKEHPDEIKAFAECFYKAVTRVVDDKAAARQLLVTGWKMDPQVADKVIADELHLLSKDGVLTDQQLQGMLEATKFTIDGAAGLTLDDVKGMYKLWKNL